MRLYEVHAVNLAFVIMTLIALFVVLKELRRHWRFTSEMKRRQAIYEFHKAKLEAAMSRLLAALSKSTEEYNAADAEVSAAMHEYERKVLGYE